MTTGFNKKFLLAIIGLIVVGFLGFSYLRKPVTSEPIVESEKIDDWKIYTNTKYGYAMKYPSTLTPVEAPDDAIYLHHVEFQVPKVTSISGITVEVRNFTTLEDEIVYRKWTVEGHLIPGKIDSEEPITVSGLPGWMLNYTSGEEKFSIAVVPYQGFVYSIKAPSNQLELYNQIISSFKFIDQNSTKLDQKAVQLVRDLPEVKAWLVLFSGPDGTGPKTGGKPVFTVDSKEGSIYRVHAYEEVPSDGHQVTFNWFNVNIETGEVTKEFNF